MDTELLNEIIELSKNKAEKKIRGNKNQISHFESCEKRVVIQTKDGRKIKSKWFNDECDVASYKSNCTKEELKHKRILMKALNLTEKDILYWHVNKKREENVIYITRHAEQRLKERNGWSKKTINRMVEKVFNEGVIINKKDHPWATDILKNDCYDPEYKLYGNFIYVFSDSTLVTVLNMPNKILKNINRMQVAR